MKRAAKTSSRTGSDKRRLKALLRQMAWNDFSIPLKEVVNGEGPKPVRRRLVE
jgi:hypothetical protein